VYYIIQPCRKAGYTVTHSNTDKVVLCQTTTQIADYVRNAELEYIDISDRMIEAIERKRNGVMTIIQELVLFDEGNTNVVGAQEALRKANLGDDLWCEIDNIIREVNNKTRQPVDPFRAKMLVDYLKEKYQ
jgi:hypothetical protein